MSTPSHSLTRHSASPRSIALSAALAAISCCAPCIAGEPASQVTKELFAALDLNSPGLPGVRKLLNEGAPTAALSLWRDQVVTRLRERDLGEYGWHGNCHHPRGAEVADYVCGLGTKEAYLEKWIRMSPGFIDVFGMSGAPGSGKRIDWFADVSKPLDWGHPTVAGWSHARKLQRTGYTNFRFMTAFVGRYWRTGNPVYLRKAFDIMSDFALHHKAGFWRDYHAKGIGDKEVRAICRADWRLNTNGLGMGWRAKNFVKITAGLAKCLGADKPGEWQDVLGPATGDLSRAELNMIPADQLAAIALSLMRDHTGKLLWFCTKPGSVPNQRSEGLKALAFLSVIFPDFKTTPQLVDYVTRGYEEMLGSNFLPDGGSLEQSFNYNTQDKKGLEELLRFFGGDAPPYAQLALAKVKARRAVDNGLQTPLGGLPQVGNHHAVPGKAVWESEEIAKRYWKSKYIHGREPLRPQEYLSKAYPYSGYYAMRSGWTTEALYLFFMNGRPQRGHSMRDNNAIQVTAYGRQLLVCGGPPTYGMYRNADAKGADFYLSESSSLKCNTVIVNGRSQAKNGPRAAKAYRTPVSSRWHTSSRYDVVDGLYNLGYSDYDRKRRRDINIDMSVEHYRCVVFVRPAKLWLVLDRMADKAGKPRDYTQIWNFAPDHEDKKQWHRSIAGFKEDQFALDEQAKRFRTTDPTGPNIELRHFGPERLAYRKHYGNRDSWLGWFAPGIGDARPAVDVHANWRSTDSDALLTLLAPLGKGQDSPVVSASPLGDGAAKGLHATLSEGVEVHCLAAPKPVRLRLGAADATARMLLLCKEASGLMSGIVVGCRSLSVHGHAVRGETEDFEFSISQTGEGWTLPFFIPEAPVIAEPKPFTHIAHAEPVTIAGARPGLEVRYTLDGSEPSAKSPVYSDAIELDGECVVAARFFKQGRPLPLVARQPFTARRWSLREPDVPSSATLTQGLRYEQFDVKRSIRIYDLMQQTPATRGHSPNCALAPWQKQRNLGLRWRGYIRIPRDGMYHFYAHSRVGARVFICNPARDLQVPPVVSASYRQLRSRGSAALKAGCHMLEVQYIEQWKKGHVLEVEVEGPGVPRQPLPDDWLFTARK